MFLLILGVFLLIVTLFLEKFKLGQLLNFIIIYVVIVCIVGYVEYTPDKEFYIYWLYTIPEKLEPFFKFVARFLVKHNYEFPELQIIFTFTYTFLLLFFISRFSKKIFIVSLLYLATIFIFYVTQLRYFMGYYAVCLALYYLYVKRNFLLTAIFLAFGIANHYGLVLFIAIVPFFYVKSDKLLSRLLIVTLGVLLFTSIVLILGATVLSQVRFIGYFFDELQSTFLGGVLTFLPYVIIVYIIYRLHLSNLKKDPNILSDKKYTFLFIMSIANITLLGGALITQVIGHRMIMTASLFQILYVFQTLKYYNGIQKTKLIVGFVFSILFLYFYLYVFIDLVVGNSSNEDILLILKSNKILNYFTF